MCHIVGASLIASRRFSDRQPQTIVLEDFQALKDLIQREFVLQVDLIIDLGAKPIFVSSAGFATSK